MACDNGAGEVAIRSASTAARPTTSAFTTTLEAGTTSVALPYESGSIEVTDAGVWVFPHLAPVALRIDPVSMEIDLEVRLEAYATWSLHGPEGLWVWTEGDDSSWTRIDPETGETVMRVPDVGGECRGIAFGGLWCATSTGELVEIDADTGDVHRHRVQSSGAFLVVAGTDIVWTLGLADGLVGLDPASGELTTPWRPIDVLPGIPSDFRATASGTLLFATPEGISEVDPIGKTLEVTIPYPRGLVALGPLDPGGGSLERPAFMLGRPEDREVRRGAPLPDVTMVVVDSANDMLVDPVVVPFAEGGRRVGDVVWMSPLRAKELRRVLVPG